MMRKKKNGNMNKMEESKKNGYIAGGIFLIIGILITVVGTDSGWSSGKITIIFGLFMVLLGIGGIWKPDIIGQPLAHYLTKLAEKQEKETIQQQNTKNSTQAVAKDYSKMNIQNHYYKSDLPEEKQVDEKKELIKEVNKDLSKDKLSNILIKCIRLAKIINSEKDVFWLENEAYGFEKNKEKINEKDNEKEVPDYRIINTEFRIASTAEIGYTPINYKLTLGHPIFEIEGWIESHEKVTSPGELVLRAPMTETFKKVYKQTMHNDPPNEDIPYIISVGELKKVINGLKLKISDFVNSIK